jgi:hypothetical protein
VSGPLPGAPVWLLDVDGVLNAKRPSWHTMPRRAYVADSAGRDWIIRWAPELIARIRKLIDAGAVEVRWCTTWCPDADRLEKLWSLPSLGRAFDTVPKSRYVGDLKLAAAREVLASGRRLIWTDDMEVPDFGPLYDELTANGQGLLIRPPGREGLSPEHMEVIEQWISNT